MSDRGSLQLVVGLALSVLLVGCAPKQPDPAEFIGGCSHDNELPELKLTAEHKALLAQRNETPRTALDYYLSLPVSFFGNVEDTTPERRVSFIEIETLSDQWLKAGHFFECDGGGFEVVMRVFETEDGPLIAMDQWQGRFEDIYRDEHAPLGEMQSISLGVPTFWRYASGVWVKADEVKLPDVDKDWVMARYRKHFKEQFDTSYPSTYIWLSYELPRRGDVLRLTGRANYMDPDGDYVWQRLRFDGRNFMELPETNP